ncbi:MAG: hypothetical protein U0X20_23730 [Caldilineaceae bacterium]
MITLLRQADLADQFERYLRDQTNSRWSVAEIYEAINQALANWSGRVSLPFRYTPTTTWPDDDTTIVLPEWMPRTFEVHVQIDAEADRWEALIGWRTAVDANGCQELQAFAARGRTYRIIYYARNGQIPTTIPVLSAAIAADATTLTLGARLPELAPVGVVDVDGEWIQYGGFDLGTATTVLNNLQRGVSSSAAASHAKDAAVQWCVMLPDIMLRRQLADQVRAYLHELYLHGAAPQDRDQHERMVSFYQSRADQFWRTWLPDRSPRMVVDYDHHSSHVGSYRL